MAGPIVIRGLSELQRDFKKLSKDVSKEIRTGLKDAAEPVRAKAQENAVGKISHIGSVWPVMRIGVTGRSVYVAPKARPHGGSARPNLAGLLMDQAMVPAVESEQDHVVERLDDVLAGLAGENGF